MQNKIMRWIETLNYPHYIIFFVTGKCNARCKMCFYEINMAKNREVDNELTIDEYEKISNSIKLINILGISGGEPFLRDDLSEIIKILYKNCSPLIVDLPTNGFYTQKIIKQVEDIVSYCKHMTVDVQLSIDGPEKIHNEIRGLKDGFNMVKETYNGLKLLKKKHRNLRLKACVVYSHYNQDHVEDLFNILETDFKELDRLVFSVVHGRIVNTEAAKFSWDKYFEICDKRRNKATVKDIKDFHSIFTTALRIVKTDFLKRILKTKDMYKRCGAGKKTIVINETGQVFPCEPLWKPVGELRANNYNLDAILRSDEIKEYNRKIILNKCTCHWNIPLTSNLIYRPDYYHKVLFEMIKIILRSICRKW